MTADGALDAQVRDLAGKRHALAIAAKILKDIDDAHAKNTASIRAIVKGAKEEIAAIEAGVRQLATDAGRDGNMHPALGVEVKRFKVITYDAAQAFAWALEHKMFIAFDAPTFEKAAPTLSPRPSWLKVSEDLRAQIATDLPKALGMAEPPPVANPITGDLVDSRTQIGVPRGGDTLKETLDDLGAVEIRAEIGGEEVYRGPVPG